MNNYNFAELLSPLRFEQIVRDLLKEEYGVFENFKEGKDGGIDFRYSASNADILVVQCKRYKNINSLIVSLKEESKKISNIKFTKYILAVAIDLSDKNKQDIIKLYNGTIENEKQIITSKDLNALLGLQCNQYIEFKYPELWMKSINVHQKIFNLGFLQHSEYLKQEIQESLKNFVPYKEYYQIIDHFRKNNVVIISGNPGIGKTTLAQAIVSNLIFFENFQLVDFTARKIQDAEAFLNTDERTVFLLDDFLGQIKFDKENDYVRLLLYFIKRIEKTDGKKMIITSREYILRKAQKEIYTIEEINQAISKYTIELSSFTRKIRTEILYSHLKNSNLEKEYTYSFLKNNYKYIIDHDNYNPRIIEHLTNAKRLKNIEPSSYFDFFVENLENPSQIWKHVYDNLPNDLYKAILIIRFMISEPVSIENLEKAISRLITNEPKFQQYSFDDFNHILKEFEGTFFKFITGYDELVDEEYEIIEFQNPSIRDFIDGFIWKEKNWIRLMINNSIYFEQLFNYELLNCIDSDLSLADDFIDKVIKDFGGLENASFGYFEYDAPDEGTFYCWKPTRYNFYLSMIVDNIDIVERTDRIKIGNFLKNEIFKYTFDELEDISEKISFLNVAELLLSFGLISSEEAISFYLQGYCDDIKELVFLEYMSRYCTKESLKLIRNNKRLVEVSDGLFLDKIETIGDKDFVDLIDFFDDFHQIKKILPLKKTKRRLKELNLDELYEKSVEKLKYPPESKEDRKKDSTEYFDISDNEIEIRLQTLSKD